jgi:uracil-DNA glycosylase
MNLGDNELARVRTDARDCTRCPLYAHATQTVFGEGSSSAIIMLVGEQPGDQEDIAGRPFVGPAGKLLDQALADAGVPRDRCYVTNAVKHFKFDQRGKRRLHKRPSAGEITQCRWWLDKEISIIRPRLIVALGATAAQSLFGKSSTISGLRGRIHKVDNRSIWVTIHPSYLLRIPDRSDAEREYRRFVADIAHARESMSETS